MIYIDASVALAHIFREPRRARDALWLESLVASRLLQYEIWTRLHSRQLARSHGAVARDLIENIGLVDLSSPVLARAVEPFPLALRTLDSLHLATIEFLRTRGQSIALASFDARLLAGARALGIPLYPA